MNVAQLLERVRLEIHNDLTDEQIIGRFNELSKRLFRKFVLPETIYGFQTVDIPYYTLPTDCTEDSIRCVVIDDIEYLKVSPSMDNPPTYFCTSFLNSLFIYPKPAEGKDAYIYYRARPIELTKLDDESNFPSDYHSLYIYDACQWIAGIQRDVDMKNNFFSEYTEIYKDAERDLKKMGLKRVKVTTIW